MSFPVTTAAIQLPTYGEPYVLVNDGNDVVYVGVRRDTLTADGFPLQPLAQLTLDGVRTFYAQAASGTQPLDMLPGGTGFAPSPGQIAAQLVASTLASVIATDIANSALPGNTATAGYNTGQRLVDNGSGITQGNLNNAVFTAGSAYSLDANGNPFQTPNYQYIDARGYHSFIIDAVAGAAATVTIWYIASVGTSPMFFRTYELAPGQETVIMDNLHGPYVVVILSNISAGSAAISYSFRFSNRVLPGELVDVGGPGTSAQSDTSGLLLSQPNIAIAANANGTTFQLPPLTGKYAITVAQGQAGNFRYWYGSQGVGNQRIRAYTAAFNDYFEIAAIRKPLYFFMVNTTATATTYGLFVTRCIAA